MEGFIAFGWHQKGGILQSGLIHQIIVVAHSSSNSPAARNTTNITQPIYPRISKYVTCKLYFGPPHHEAQTMQRYLLELVLSLPPLQNSDS